jgi:hypothetical protein
MIAGYCGMEAVSLVVTRRQVGVGHRQARWDGGKEHRCGAAGAVLVEEQRQMAK